MIQLDDPFIVFSDLGLPEQGQVSLLNTNHLWALFRVVQNVPVHYWQTAKPTSKRKGWTENYWSVGFKMVLHFRFSFPFTHFRFHRNVELQNCYPELHMWTAVSVASMLSGKQERAQNQWSDSVYMGIQSVWEREVMVRNPVGVSRSRSRVNKRFLSRLLL